MLCYPEVSSLIPADPRNTRIIAHRLLFVYIYFVILLAGMIMTHNQPVSSSASPAASATQEVYYIDTVTKQKRVSKYRNP